MLTKIRSSLKKLKRDEEGLTLVEYGIGAVLAVTVGAVSLTYLGAQVENELLQADGVMEGTNASAAVGGSGV